MNVYLFNVADLDAGDGTGRTYRQVNNEMVHTIPIGALVECVADGEYPSDYDGIRVFVVRHTRDCDGTPLYSLCMKRNPDEYDTYKIMHGFNGDGLSVIRMSSEGK